MTIKTSQFMDQLAPSRDKLFADNIRDVEKGKVPTTLKGLKVYGLGDETISELGRIAWDGESERRVVCTFLLSFFGRSDFKSKKGILRWFERKGGIDPFEKSCCDDAVERLRGKARGRMAGMRSRTMTDCCCGRCPDEPCELRDAA